DQWWWARRGPRRSTTLLNGPLFCGRCGRRMSVYYSHAEHRGRYQCLYAKVELGEPPCQGVQAQGVDDLVLGRRLHVVEPASLELSLQAADRVEQERERLHRHWQQRRERAAYEAARAARQYDAVDPGNRLVARTLERQWEERLAARQRLEEDYARFLRQRP